MNELSMSRALMGTTRSNPGQTTTAYGIASSESADGLVMVDMGGDTVSPDDDQSIECETTFKVYEGDEVIVSLVGADGSGKTPIVVGVVGRGDEQEEKAKQLRARAEELREDIENTATEIIQYQNNADARMATIESGYLSKSEANGSYMQMITAKIEETARQIRESFNYEELASSVDNLEQYYNVLSGEIRRGFIDINGVKTFGIVVSSRNVFSAAGGTYTPSGETNVYYEIDTGECFGFYTATGWQFWKGKEKLGWFDTETGQLHVENINIETQLLMGEWRLINKGDAWGLKYIGA